MLVAYLVSWSLIKAINWSMLDLENTSEHFLSAMKVWRGHPGIGPISEPTFPSLFGD
jgi:hypothetical protein